MPNSKDGNNSDEATTLHPNLEGQPVPVSIPASSEFKQKSVRGGALTLLGQGVGMALQIGTTVILARLLLPSDYGLQSMVLTLTAFFSLFKDAGLSVATIQRENLTHEQISTLFWVNIGLGILLTIIVASAAPFLATFYKEPRLFWITVASASIFFFNSLSVQHRALLDRSMRFATNVKIDILCSTASAIIAIGMAALGYGYWSLICQNISLPLIGTAAVWIAIPWMPGKPRWTSELKSMVRFGGTVTLNSVVVYIAYNIEKVLLGRYWGAAPLGIYTRAYQLATLPVQQLIGAVHSVAFSVLSRMQGEAERLKRAYLKSLSLIVSLTIPIVISSGLFAEEIVRVVLGPKWLGAASVLQMLAPTVMFLALVNPFSWFLRSTGQVARSLKIAFLICPVVILGIVAGLHYGPRGVAMGYSSAMALLFVPVVAWATYGTGITARAYWDAVKKPITAGALGGVVAWLFRLSIANNLAPLPLLAAELTISSLAYAAILLFVLGEKEFFWDLVKQLGLGRRSESVQAPVAS